MKEQRVDILSSQVLTTADAICFTSNGVIKTNKELVMGAGVAKAFKDMWPFLPLEFGLKVSLRGNQVYRASIPRNERALHCFSFPTKNHWKNDSDINLIIKSAKELMKEVESLNLSIVYLPRPGCFNGGLDWEKEVKPAIKDILDDRIIICYL